MFFTRDNSMEQFLLKGDIIEICVDIDAREKNQWHQDCRRLAPVHFV